MFLFIYCILLDATYDVKCNSDNEFEALRFSTSCMNSMFNAWLEFCLIDSTYKLLKLKFPVVLLNTVDGNGSTEIVNIYIVYAETEEILKWFIQKVKDRNVDACKRIRSFMGDKDITARGIVKEIFGIPMYICAFHTAKIFNRTVTTDGIGVTKEERELSLAILEKMIYAYSEERYMELYHELVRCVPESVCVYFQENWHGIRHDWVKGLMTDSNFLNDTNNRNESLNAKLKLFCEISSFFTEFVSDFLTYLTCVHNNERNQKAVLNFCKKPTYKMSEDQASYFDYVTKYDYDFIDSEMSKTVYVVNITSVGPQIFVVKSKNGISKYVVTPVSCTCKNFISMGLPCKHIFKI